jgi:hypothetical protein
MVPVNRSFLEPLMKRVLMVLVAGVVTFATVYGFAASLNLNSDSYGAAHTSVAACQSGTLTATYSSTYSSSVPGFTTGTVTVTGLQAGCYSKAFKVELTGTGDTSLGESVGTTPSSGTTFTATFSPAVSAAAVLGVSVVISG